jgi:hypothetical protein
MGLGRWGRKQDAAPLGLLSVGSPGAAHTARIVGQDGIGKPRLIARQARNIALPRTAAKLGPFRPLFKR